MSESAGETGTGATGEVVNTGVDTSAEDQAAEEALHDLVQQEDPEELKKQVDKWRKAAQRHERTARDNSAAATKLQKLEDANKSELQKAVDAQAAAERERDAVRSEHTRLVAAAAHDLEPDMAGFLGDGTEDEINARADQLAGLIRSAAEKLAAQLVEQTNQQGNGGRAPGGARNRRPVESMRPGAAPAGSAATSANDMFRQLLTGENRD
jgi:hypothetical protein